MLLLNHWLQNIRDLINGVEIPNPEIDNTDIQMEANLRGCDLSNADLSKADLLMADLTGADLTKADLRGTTLNAANLTDADLSEANLSQADLIKANLTNTDLTKADLSGADLREADLTGANLSKADLRKTDFTEAPTDEPHLTGATLTQADLREARLRGANFRGINLKDTNLTGTDITSAHTSGAEISPELSAKYGNITEEKEIEPPSAIELVKQPFKNSETIAYAQNLLTDHPELYDEYEWVRANITESLRQPESEYDKEKKARAYLLPGWSADPYTEDRTLGVGPEDIKTGYVRLTVTDFTVDGQNALKFHFGRGSWAGGYIWFLGEEIDHLQDVLISLKRIDGGEVPGQGKVLDLDAFPFDRERNDPHRVSGSTGQEEGLKLIVSTRMEDGIAADFRLGDGEKAGIDVTLTDAQWLDLLATIDVLSRGTREDIPGEYSGYPRIGPSGKDTWSIGTGIEEEINPDPPWEHEGN